VALSAAAAIYGTIGLAAGALIAEATITLLHLRGRIRAAGR
jgi:isocitrate dehydrogenase